MKNIFRYCKGNDCEVQYFESMKDAEKQCFIDIKYDCDEEMLKLISDQTITDECFQELKPLLDKCLIALQQENIKDAIQSMNTYIGLNDCNEYCSAFSIQEIFFSKVLPADRNTKEPRYYMCSEQFDNDYGVYSDLLEED